MSYQSNIKISYSKYAHINNDNHKSIEYLLKNVYSIDVHKLIGNYETKPSYEIFNLLSKEHKFTIFTLLLKNNISIRGIFKLIISYFHKNNMKGDHIFYSISSKRSSNIYLLCPTNYLNWFTREFHRYLDNKKNKNGLIIHMTHLYQYYESIINISKYL